MNPLARSTPHRTPEPSDGTPAATPLAPEVLPPAYRLHSPTSSAWATFFGTPAAGSIVLALTYWKWGRKGVAAAAVFAGFLTAGIIGWLAVITPASVPALVFLVPQILGGYFVAKWLQGRRFDAHVAAGGRKASPLIGVGIGLGYSRGATRDDAHDFGEALKRAGYFDDTAPAEVLITRRPGAREISFAGGGGMWDDAANVDYIRQVVEYIATDIGGQPITVLMLDENLYEEKRCLLTDEWRCQPAP